MLTFSRGIRQTALWVTALAACLFGPVAGAQEAERPKQILVLNSSRQTEQFSQVSERELPTLLAAGLEQRIDYYTEYFDANRFPHPQYETVYVDFLRQKYAGKRFDLLLMMGDVAMDFVSRHHRELFADTPAVFYSLVPPLSRPANSTGLVNTLHFGPSLDLALALQPELEQVYVVSGVTPADKSFENQARAEFRRFEGRVKFTYLSGLVAKDLEERLRTLPPHSAVYYVVVSQDAAGENFQQMPYLSHIAATANAPTYGWADVAADAGIVGGRRRDQLNLIKAIAAMGLRVLRGERADDIPVSSPDTDVDSVDWRELRRWGIDESRVPPGTRVLFRPPSMWDQYEGYIIGAVMLMLAQTALIAGLLVQRARRQQVERELRGSQDRLRVSYDRIRHLSRRLLGEQEAERARIARELHDDINQQIAILSMELDWLRSDQLPVHSAKRLSRAVETTQGISTSVRELSHRLHPSRLELLGLVAGLDSLRRDLSPPHLSIAFVHHDVPTVIDQDIALCFFRVAQEALGNAVKHSDARHVSVELTGAPSSLALTITDDGKGFDVESVRNGGLGLVSIRERVESIGGLLEIQAFPASGTCLRVAVPIRTGEAGPVRMASTSDRTRAAHGAASH
jgi:signal transduction histidine kinase